jgi:hypothetical protein
MTANQLIKMLEKLPPDTIVLGWMDGETLTPYDLDELDYCAESKNVLLDFKNSDEYASN